MHGPRGKRAAFASRLSLVLRFGIAASEEIVRGWIALDLERSPALCLPVTRPLRRQSAWHDLATLVAPWFGAEWYAGETEGDIYATIPIVAVR